MKNLQFLWLELKFRGRYEDCSLEEASVKLGECPPGAIVVVVAAAVLSLTSP